MANEGLIRLKDKKPDAAVIGVCVLEELARNNRLFKTVGEVAEQEQQKQKRVMEVTENKEKQGEGKMVVGLFWKPRGSVVVWFEDQGLE